MSQYVLTPNASDDLENITPGRHDPGAADTPWLGRVRAVPLAPEAKCPLYSVGQEAEMVDVVEVLIPVDSAVAGALADPGRRETIGRLVSQILQPQSGHDSLLAAAQRLSAAAKDRGLTEEALEAELAAHKRERTR